MVAKLCPMFREPCKEHGCEWYIHIIGANPQTGEQFDKFGCAQAFMPLLTIENSQQQRQTAAAVESFRNEVAKASERNFALEVAERFPQLMNGAGQ